MKEVEIAFQPLDGEAADSWISRFALENGLVVISKGTLAKFPGCVHWHLKKPGQTGTLETTWWPQKRRFWWKVASNRGADWIDLLQLEG